MLKYFKCDIHCYLFSSLHSSHVLMCFFCKDLKHVILTLCCHSTYINLYIPLLLLQLLLLLLMSILLRWCRYINLSTLVLHVFHVISVLHLATGSHDKCFSKMKKRIEKMNNTERFIYTNRIQDVWDLIVFRDTIQTRHQKKAKRRPKNIILTEIRS
jgi:hypothetical protein